MCCSGSPGSEGEELSTLSVLKLHHTSSPAMQQMTGNMELLLAVSYKAFQTSLSVA